MGEFWHNNHHAFPGSARLGLTKGQWDPGWWVLKFLARVGLVWRIRLPGELAPRPELFRINKTELEAVSISGRRKCRICACVFAH
jgi:stearoyl-CoA desaturase (delta-9 desaturase)